MEQCYRHADRETGVSCSNCGRAICTDCMTTTRVGMRCPECASDRTPVKTMRSLTGDPSLTYVLMGVNVLLFLGGSLSGGLGGGGGILFSEGALSRATVGSGELWRLLTSGFLHGGLFHLFTNMFGLYILGGMLEPAIGRLRYALVYFVSLLAGSFGALLLQPSGYTVGASGAIFGLMAAAVVIMRARGINPMESGLGVWLGLNLLITFLVPGISIGGHLGGLVGGGLAAALLFELGKGRRLPALVPAALVVAIGVLAITGSIFISTA